MRGSIDDSHFNSQDTDARVYDVNLLKHKAAFLLYMVSYIRLIFLLEFFFHRKRHRRVDKAYLNNHLDICVVLAATLLP